MLDTIIFTKNQDGSFTKTVTHVEIITDVTNEINAIQAQLDAFAIGRSSDPKAQASIDTAIQNYQQQLAILKS